MIRRSYIRNQARKESYLRERREGKNWSELKYTEEEKKIALVKRQYDLMDLTHKHAFSCDTKITAIWIAEIKDN